MGALTGGGGRRCRTVGGDRGQHADDDPSLLRSQAYLSGGDRKRILPAGMGAAVAYDEFAGQDELRYTGFTPQ